MGGHRPGRSGKRGSLRNQRWNPSAFFYINGKVSGLPSPVFEEFHVQEGLLSLRYPRSLRGHSTAIPRGKPANPENHCLLVRSSCGFPTNLSKLRVLEPRLPRHWGKRGYPDLAFRANHSKMKDFPRVIYGRTMPCAFLYVRNSPRGGYYVYGNKRDTFSARTAFYLFGAPNLPYLYLISTRIALFLREKLSPRRDLSREGVAAHFLQKIEVLLGP